jgi:hypothetical protein
MKINPPVIETVALSKLKPWAKNPRIKHAVEAIARSIESFGYLSPIVVQKKTYRVLSGHGRLKALKRLKNVKEVPVIIADVNERNAQLYALADNRLHDLSIFDMGKMNGLLKGLGKMDLKFTGLNSFKLEQALKAEKRQSEDKPKKITFYANRKNSTKLIVVFETKKQLQFVKRKIEELQGNSDKSAGDVVYWLFRKKA